MAQRDHYPEIDYRGWGHAGELYPDALSGAAVPYAATAESQPVPPKRSVQQKLAAFLSQSFSEIDPMYKIWMATLIIFGLTISAALITAFALTR